MRIDSGGLMADDVLNDGGRNLCIFHQTRRSAKDAFCSKGCIF